MQTKFDQALSPYAFAKKVGKRPQMVYNYIGKGYIDVRETETGKMVIDPEEMERIATKWSKKGEVTEEV